MCINTKRISKRPPYTTLHKRRRGLVLHTTPSRGPTTAYLIRITTSLLATQNRFDLFPSTQRRAVDRHALRVGIIQIDETQGGRRSIVPRQRLRARITGV